MHDEDYAAVADKLKTQDSTTLMFSKLSIIVSLTSCVVCIIYALFSICVSAQAKFIRLQKKTDKLALETLKSGNGRIRKQLNIVGQDPARVALA